MPNNLPIQGGVKVELSVFRSILQFLDGSWEEALQTIRNCLQETRSLGDLHSLANLDMTLAWLTVELHTFGQRVDWEEAESALAEALELWERGVDDIVRPLCQLSEIRIHQGRWQEAVPL